MGVFTIARIGKDMKNVQYVVTEEYDTERIDKFLTSMNEDLSRSYIQRLIKEQRVLVNDKIVKANYKVNTDDIVDYTIPDAIIPKIEPEEIPLDILYEDKDVLVVNKPKGMVVHPAAGHYSHTLVNAVMYHCHQDLSGINGIMRPGIVHRIDRNTTGSIIICKNDMAHHEIAAQLKAHTIKRRYHAIVYGVLKEEEGCIEKPIGRHPNDRKKMSVYSNQGKEAITHYKVLKRFRQYTYIECALETGRTHQIRVHMASIGHPILGDDVYAGQKCPFHLEGQTLHAKVLGFIHPSTKQYIEILAPLPDYFLHLLKILD